MLFQLVALPVFAQLEDKFYYTMGKVLIAHMMIRRALNLSVKKEATYYYAVIQQLPSNTIIFLLSCYEFKTINLFDIQTRPFGSQDEVFWPYVFLMSMVSFMIVTMDDHDIYSTNLMKAKQIAHHLICVILGIISINITYFGFTIVLVSQIGELGNFTMNVYQLTKNTKYCDSSNKFYMMGMSLSNILCLIFWQSGVQAVFGKELSSDYLIYAATIPSMIICYARMDQINEDYNNYTKDKVKGE